MNNTTFELNSNDNFVSLYGGMSTEICFAKFISNRMNKTYKGWTPVPITGKTPDIIVNTVKYICSTVRDVTSKEDYCVISPGMISIPYVTELTNCMYLPSQILISVKSIKELEQILETTKFHGIKCYAEIGYDGCIPNVLVAWIKFIELPEDYITLLSDLHIKEIFTLCVNHPGSGVIGGENKARIYNKIFTYTNQIKESTIIFLYINEGYGHMTKTEEEELFKHCVYDFNSEYIRQEVKYIQDWESGIIHPDKLFNNWNGRSFIVCFNNTSEIYKLSQYLSTEFIKKNGITEKGIVLNPYFINNPLYESYYGYVGISYWQQNKNFANEINTIDIKNKELWVNKYRNECNYVIENLKSTPTCLIEVDGPNGDELANWIITHKPETYSNIEYLTIFELKKCLEEHNHKIYQKELSMYYLEKIRKSIETYYQFNSFF